jgi:hypothetical protein
MPAKGVIVHGRVAEGGDGVVRQTLLLPRGSRRGWKSFFGTKVAIQPRAVHCLFSVLSVDRVAEVFLALLQERKVFFVSDSQIVLGYVIEALLSFLYPLRWEHVILPILPQKLLQLL